MKKFLWEEMKYKTLTFFSFLETFCSGCTCVPHPETPSNLPPHSILLGFPSTPAVNALFHASNFDWSSISHMVIYMFQYYSLKSSHPHLSHRVQKTLLYICWTLPPSLYFLFFFLVLFSFYLCACS